MQEIEFTKAVLAEDIGRGDLFARVVEPTPAKARVVAKSDGVLAGQKYVEPLTKLYDVTIDWCFHDGQSFGKGEDLLYIQGDNTTLLMLERTLLNILHHASSMQHLQNTTLRRLANFPLSCLIPAKHDRY